jgi:hypothetical protein
MTNATLPTWSSVDWQKVDKNTNPNWYTGPEYKTVSWSVSTAQTSTTMAAEDLTYSNNISATGKGGRYTYTYDTSSSKWTLNDEFGNGQLTWTPKTDDANETTGKFDKGHLEFHHALAWIEINLKESDGYNQTSADDFKWTANKAAAEQNITLKGFNTSGTFDVTTATWSDQISNVDITQLYEKSVTAAARQLYAYVLPGTNLLANENKVVEFELDNSKYYVTGKQIAEAIQNYYKTTGRDDNIIVR